MSAFERAGVAYLAGSRKSLKIIIDEKKYFIHVKDIYRALDNPKFQAHILQLVKPSIKEATKPKQFEVSFSVVLKDTRENQKEAR